MIGIHQIADHQYQLVEDGKILFDDVFFKIERLNQNSNYYLLFPNESCFLLYNILRHRFAFNTKSVSSAYSFARIEAYSFETGSFAAYRSDVSYVHLIYEDGSYETDIYKYIGPESNDLHRSRPIQLTGFAKNENMFRWIYFNTKERKYGWNKKDAKEYNNGVLLANRFNGGYYSTYKDNLYQLHFFKKGNSIGSNNPKILDYFDFIQEDERYLICKLHNKNIYRIYKKDYSTKPLVSFSSKPVRLKGKHMFVCKELDGYLSFFNLTNNKILENDNWLVESEYEIVDNYLFVKTPGDKSWKIFSCKNGKEVYTGWNTITLKREGEELRLFVDANDHLESIPISRIEEFHLQYMAKLSGLSQRIVSKQTGYKDEKSVSDTKVIEPEAVLQSNLSASEKSIQTVLESSNRLPGKIDFITSLSQIKCSSNNTIYCERKTDILHKDAVVFWIDKSNHIAYATRFTFSKAHLILWHKQLDNHEADLIIDIPNKFFKVNLSDVTEQNVIEKVGASCHQSETIQKIINDISKKKKLRELDIRYSKLVTFMMQEDYPKEKIEEVVKILLPDWKKTKEPINKEKVVFTFNDESFSIAPDETWIIKDPFTRQTFLRKSDLISILLDNTFSEYSEIEGVDYEMVGQGQDRKFDQDFTSDNVNKLIRDNDRRIMLFKRGHNTIVFFDEVECIGYHSKLENGVGSRKLIIFHLKSKCRRSV